MAAHAANMADPLKEGWILKTLLCYAVFRPENLLDEHRTDDTALEPHQAIDPPKAAPDGKVATAPAPAANGGKVAGAAPLEYELHR